MAEAWVVNPGKKSKHKKRRVSRKTRAKLRRAARRRVRKTRRHASALGRGSAARRAVQSLACGPVSRIAALRRSCPSFASNPGGLVGGLTRGFHEKPVMDAFQMAIGAFGNSYLTNQAVSRFAPGWSSGFKRAGVAAGMAGISAVLTGFISPQSAPGAFAGAMVQTMIRLYDDVTGPAMLPAPAPAATVKGMLNYNYSGGVPGIDVDDESDAGLSGLGCDEDEGGMSGIDDEDQFQD